MLLRLEMIGTPTSLPKQTDRGRAKASSNDTPPRDITRTLFLKDLASTQDAARNPLSAAEAVLCPYLVKLYTRIAGRNHQAAFLSSPFAVPGLAFRCCCSSAACTGACAILSPSAAWPTWVRNSEQGPFFAEPWNLDHHIAAGPREDGNTVWVFWLREPESRSNLLPFL